jgi:hypothetical protein
MNLQLMLLLTAQLKFQTAVSMRQLMQLMQEQQMNCGCDES